MPGKKHTLLKKAIEVPREDAEMRSVDCKPSDGDESKGQDRYRSGLRLGSRDQRGSRLAAASTRNRTAVATRIYTGTAIERTLVVKTVFHLSLHAS